MERLYFKYGTMGASKTAEMLMVAHRYREIGKSVHLFKPALASRDGEARSNLIAIKSRIGLEAGGYAIYPDTDFYEALQDIPDHGVILVDEAQFLTTLQVEQLATLSRYHTIICYGLLTDFQSHLFEGSKRLIELASNVEELKSVCACGDKANFNVRMDADGIISLEGDVVGIEAESCKYKPMCYHCFNDAVEEQKVKKGVNNPHMNEGSPCVRK